jgi:probable F420-dependent oxidoreductase
VCFSVQGGLMSSAAEWRDLAVEAERLGFAALYVPDHPGVTADPFAALASAASATSTLRLGTYVLNAGVRDPLAVATGAATVDLVSEGRMTLGLGAGHTPAEWTMAGRPYPSSAERVARLAEFVEIVDRLLKGEVVSFHGQFLSVDDAYLLTPRPIQSRVPLLIGGNGKRLLSVAGKTADIISLTGLGKTLEDGHRHAADWSRESIDERVRTIGEAGRTGRGAPVLDALVQHLEVTDQADVAAERSAHMAPGLTSSDVMGAPYALIGTIDEIVDQLRGYRDRWGFRSYVLRSSDMKAAAPIVARMQSVSRDVEGANDCCATDLGR